MLAVIASLRLWTVDAVSARGAQRAPARAGGGMGNELRVGLGLALCCIAGCDGAPVAPPDAGSDAPPTIATVSLHAAPWSDPSAPARGVVLWFFESGEIADSCGAGCQEVTTDDEGAASVRATAGADYAYRAFARAGPTAGTSFVETLLDRGTATFSSAATVSAPIMTAGDVDIIYALSATARTPGSALIIGRIYDGSGTLAAGRTARAFSGGTEIAGARVAYLMTAGPATTSSGTFVVLNVPAGARVELESWNGTAREGCESVPVRANATTLADVLGGSCAP